MPQVTIPFSKSALKDFEALHTGYLERGVADVGKRVVHEIVDSIEHLAGHPEMVRIVAEFGQAFLRKLIRPPFCAVYRRDKRHVPIVKV